jgi:hypothetical protein
MQIDERIPDMSDKELDTLHANAKRLAESGSAKQQLDAGRLLPLINAALETRKADRAAERASALAEKKRTDKRKAPAAKSKKAPAVS